MASTSERAFSKFAARVLAKLQARTVPVATNTQLLNGKTVAQVQSLVTKTIVGLSQVENVPVATQAEAEAGTEQTRTLTPARLSQAVAALLAPDQKVKGDVLSGFSASSGSITDKLCYRLNVIDDATQLATVQNYTESFANVFNNWKRFSHGATETFPFTPSELNNWTYDSATDSIKCTINSASIIGFVSTESFDDYTMKVEVSSLLNTDDDSIGVVLAFSEEAGIEYTLMAGVNFANQTKCFGIYYNYGRASSKTLTNNNLGYPADNPYDNGAGSLKTGWKGAGVVGFNVRRIGDIITVTPTVPGASTVYRSDLALTIDLNSDPLLARFKGPQRFGYWCHSEDASTWKSLERPGDKYPIINAATLDTYVYTAGAWVLQAAGSYVNYLKKRRLYTNQITGKLYATGDTLNKLYKITKGS